MTLASKGLSIAEIVAKVKPSVVIIRAKYPKGFSYGTGVVVTSDGEVLTNAHVVNQAQLLLVSFADQATLHPAVLLGLDVAADLARLRIDDVRVMSAPLASSASLRVGDALVAIGDALDLSGGFTVTHGIVSALERKSGALSGLIQTDAGISSGMSGGPLVNAAGQIVGITNRNEQPTPTSAVEDIGYAIPSDRAQPVLVRLRRNAQR